MKHFTLASLASGRRPYDEFIRSDNMSAGLYVLPAGGVDDQSPHAEDEIYVVVSGKARFTSGEQTVDVATGDTIFVPAHERHRFHDIAERLELIVVFAPPETS
ncbi:MAG TPA: cupin domain-containing protein [Candidatus Limnocylindrales bacterium]|nr:cupin domain-containing protein [Candidatus Limnocylindrales bacterium]